MLKGNHMELQFTIRPKVDEDDEKVMQIINSFCR